MLSGKQNLKKNVSELEFEGKPGQNNEVLGVQMYIWEISPAECVKMGELSWWSIG